MTYIQNNSIYWIEVERVNPNPFQPRREFNQSKLNDLAESIKTYGLLQPLVVTRREEEKPNGGMVSVYELISGERRLRASKIAGLIQVPVIIRTGEESDQMKLELAIIENLQREDLNPVERAQAFHQLANDFHFKHTQIAKKVGKSREYVSNTIRLLSLPEEIKVALSQGRISEGHARPIMMLKDKPDEQITLFKEVIFKKLTVRESEAIARRVAYDKVRKQSRAYDPKLVEMENKLAENLGTRVFIEKRTVGGKIMIDFFSNDDLQKIISLLQQEHTKRVETTGDTRPEPRSEPVSSFMSGITNIKQSNHQEQTESPVKDPVTSSRDETVNPIEEAVENAGSTSEEPLVSTRGDSAESAGGVYSSADEYTKLEKIATEKTKAPYFPGNDVNSEEDSLSTPNYGGENEDKNKEENPYSVGDFTI